MVWAWVGHGWAMGIQGNTSPPDSPPAHLTSLVPTSLHLCRHVSVEEREPHRARSRGPILPLVYCGGQQRGHLRWQQCRQVLQRRHRARHIHMCVVAVVCLSVPTMCLSVPVCACLSLSLPVCPCLSLSVPACPCLSLPCACLYALGLLVIPTCVVMVQHRGVGFRPSSLVPPPHRALGMWLSW
jgi:hypothetical protein